MTFTNSEKEALERERHIEELTRRLENLAGKPVATGFSEDCSDDIRERFLEQVLAFEEQEEKPLFDALTGSGVDLPAPAELDDEELRAKLWEVIRAMSLLGAYLRSTDHLSDRELYERLWKELLPEPTILMPDNPEFACHIDIIGSGSDEDIQTYLRYYADEERREDWAREWPGDPIPAHEDPPYDRDRHLPGAFMDGSGIVDREHC